MKVGIVGAGIGGLTLHHALRTRGIESLVFEADDEPGGVIRSRREDGHVLELGPQRTRLTAGMADLVGELELQEAVVEAADLPVLVYFDGELHVVPMSVGAAITTDALSWRGKVRAALEPLTGPPRDDESVEAYLERAFGREFARRIGGPLYGGIYGTHPGRMPVRYSLARALDRFGVDRSVLVSLARSRLQGRDPPPVVSFEEGLQTLPEALHDAHRDTIELGNRVERIERREARFDLVTGTGATTVDRVVATTPAPVTASLLESEDPPTATALRTLRYNPLVVVHLEADRRLEASGFQIQFDEDLRTLGVTCNGSLFDRDGLYTAFLGGDRTPDLVEWPAGRLERVAQEEFTAITGAEARVLGVHRILPGMPAYDTTWTALEDVEPPAGIHLLANYHARAGIPGRVEAGTNLAEALVP